MSISQVIAKSQASDAGSSGSDPKDSLERQLDAAEFYGYIKPNNPQVASQQTQPKKRGRPPGSKSKSPARTIDDVPDFPTTTPHKKSKIDEVIDSMNKNRLLTKLRAYNAYWPDICPLTNIELASLEIADLERLIDMFELSVNSFSEIVDIPQSIKATIAKLEPIAINLAATNPRNPWLSKGRYMSGFSELMVRDPNVDRNVKLLSIRMLGRLPRHPLLSLFYHICGIALHVISINEAREQHATVSEEYQNL
jgi:hypothetical protein